MLNTPTWTRRILSVNKIDCGLLGFLLTVAFVNALVFQRPLYALALSTLSALDWSGGLALTLLFVLQFTATFTIFSLLGFVSDRKSVV